MIFGSADSDDEVPSTIRISSLMYFRNLTRLKPVARAMPPSTTKTKKRQVTYIASHQLTERDQRADAVAAHREGHGAEGADRRQPHHDPDDAEQRAAGLIQDGDQRRDALAERQRGEPEQHGEEQHLQNLAAREGVDHRVGDDVEDEIDGRQAL